MVGSPRLGMMRILRSAGLVVMVLALIFFFEDIWALRNDVKVTIVREFKEHVLGEDLPTDSRDQSLGEHMTQMIPVEQSATPSRKHLPSFVGNSAMRESNILQQSSNAAKTRGSRVIEEESASSLPPPKSKSLPPPSQPPTLKSPPPSPPPKSAAPPPEPSANLASPPPSSPLKPTFPPPTPEIVQAHAKSNENPIPAAVAGAPGQTIIANNAGSAPLEVDYTYVPASPKACAPECSFHGTCDADLGQCQCPAGRGGLDCSQTLTPSCHLAGALANHMVSGCPFDLEGGGGQAVSCACLRECWGIGIDLSPTWSCFDDSTMKELEHIASVEELMAAPQVRLDLRTNSIAADAHQAELKAWSPNSMCPDSCNGRGVCHKGECKCRPNGGWRGMSCNESYTPFCINQCNGNGECMSGFCKCTSGFFGIDCSIPVDIAERNNRTFPETFPKVFVYELPPKYNVWYLTRCGGGLTRAAMHSESGDVFEEVYGRHKTSIFLTERFLTSQHRVFDPLQADYFFVPLWDSCNHVGRGLTEYITEGVDYISSAFPYWKVAFDRHLLVSALDEGACKYNQHPELSRPKWLVHWGLNGRRTGPACAVDGESPSCYKLGKDVVIPPWIPHEGQHSTDHVARSAFLHFQDDAQKLAEAHKARARQLYVDRQLEYSEALSTPGCPATQGVMQQIKEEDVVTAQSGGFVDHMEGYATSVFCLATASIGWSQQAILAALHGCIPVIIQDNVTMPFEEDLPYERFAIRLFVSESSRIEQILATVSEEDIQQYQAALGCIWRRFVWSSIHGAYADEDGSQDAFASLLEILDVHLFRERTDNDTSTVLETSCSSTSDNKVLVEDGLVEKVPSTAS